MCVKCQSLDKFNRPKRKVPSVTELIKRIVAEVVRGRPYGNKRPAKHGPNRNRKGIPFGVLADMENGVFADNRGGLQNKPTYTPCVDVHLEPAGCFGGRIPVSPAKNSVV